MTSELTAVSAEPLTVDEIGKALGVDPVTDDDVAAARAIERAAISAERDRHRAEVEALRTALVESRRIVQDCLNAMGPCDHDVGICNCDMVASIRQSDAALAARKEQR